MDALTAYETADAMAIAACSRLPIYGGVFKYKREFIAKSTEEPFDIAILKLRTQRLRKWKPDVYMQYVKTPDEFEKLQRYRIKSKTIHLTLYRRKKSFTNKNIRIMEKTMDFGGAIAALKQGKKVSRKGWNGKGMFLWLKQGNMIESSWCKDPMLKGICDANGGTTEGLPTICMKTTDNKVLTGWLASQTDMLSEDWVVNE